MRRRLFTVLAVLSLLLCVAALVFWIRTRRVDYFGTYTTGHEPAGRTTVGAGATRKGLMFWVIRGPSGWAPGFGGSTWEGPVGAGYDRFDSFTHADKRVAFAGFRYYVRAGGGTGVGGPSTVYHLNVPYWLAVAAAAVPPGLWVRAWLKRRRSQGLCPTCGYDLRATPERCPECGTIPAKLAA
jgi:hypothetical protein